MTNNTRDWEDKRVSIGSTTVTVGERIGTGNEGQVFLIKGQPEDVIKIFEPNRRDSKEPKIRAMIGDAPPDPTAENKGFQSIIWPEAIASEASSGSFLGYKMPYRDLDNWMGAFEYADRKLSWDRSDPKNRFKTARNLAIVVRNVHKTGHAIGDFNDRNILMADDYVTLIDTDAFTIQSGDTIYSDTSYFPRYSPPEKRDKSLRAVQRADYFCLSVHIFQLLMEGFHPFQVDGDDAYSGDWPEMIQANPFPFVSTEADIKPYAVLENKYSQLPNAVQSLFAECFADGSKSHPWGRPTPTDWIKTLGSLSEYSVDVDLDKNGTTSGATDTGGLAELPDFGSNGSSSTTGESNATAATNDLSLPSFDSSGSTGADSGQSTSDDADDDPDLPDFAT